MVSFTLCVQDRQLLFDDARVVGAIADQLTVIAARHNAAIHVWLFMPDHLHVLAEGLYEDTDLLRFIDTFKQSSGFWLARNKPSMRWQKSYYDHILREVEDAPKHARYILENPVRAGIVDDWLTYPHKGSTVYDFATW